MKTQLTQEVIASVIFVATIGITIAVAVYKWLNKLFKE